MLTTVMMTSPSAERHQMNTMLTIAAAE